jgi:hypothetical protein
MAVMSNVTHAFCVVETSNGPACVPVPGSLARVVALLPDRLVALPSVNAEVSR